MSQQIVGFRGRGCTRFAAGGPGRVVGTPGGGGGTIDPPGGWTGTQSPTGRNPLFIANSARQDVWHQMYVDYQANTASPATRGGILAKQVHDAALLGATYYANVGQYATWMYQMTGQQSWCDLAYSQIQGWLLTLPPSTDINPYRDWVPMHVVMLDWLWPGLTPTQRTTILDHLVAWMDYVNTTTAPWSGEAISGDSDQILGHYMVIALLHLSHPENTTVERWWTDPATGGLTATAANHTSTARNSINEFFATLAVGGEYIEGGNYNQRTAGHNTVPEMEAIATATGQRNFPEWDAWLASYALNIMGHWTPDLLLPWGWGDWESPYEQELNDWSNASREVAGILQGTVAGEQLQQFILDMEAKYGLENGSPTSFEPFQPGQWFQLYNPNAPAQAWKTEANKRQYASGKGVLLAKSGYTAADSLFAVDSGQWIQDTVQGSWWVQHLAEYMMACWLYKNGEWVLKTPFGYNNIGVRGAGQNIPLMHGLNAAMEYKRVQHHVLDPTYVYLCLTSGGSMQEKSKPPLDLIAVHEWTRSYVQIPGLTDVVICYDRAYVTAITDVTKYPSGITELSPRERIEGGLISGLYPVPAPLHRKQLIWHMPVSPTIGGQDVSWTTPGLQAVKLTQLYPASTTKTIRSENALLASNDYDWAGTVTPSTFGYHVVMYPTTTQDWDTFLGVLYCGGTPGVLVSKSNGGWQGVHGTRPSQDDFLALFNATQGATLNTTPYHASHAAALATTRFRAVGCTISWTAVGSNTLVLLNDLDPAHNWTINKDGAGAVSLAVDSGGHATYTQTGSGAHSVVLA